MLERVHLLMTGWRSLLARLADTGSRMTDALDELGLTELVTSIDGLSAVGAAVILAETGDLSRFASARSVVKHAGLNPARTPRPPWPARPGSPAAAGPGCGSPPGARSGSACAITGCCAPGTRT